LYEIDHASFAGHRIGLRCLLITRYRTDCVNKDSGRLLDPVTPPGLAAPLLKWLPNGRQVLMHNATHSTYECQEKLARDFIELGAAKGLDASCVEGIKRLPFVTSLPPLPASK